MELLIGSPGGTHLPASSENKAQRLGKVEGLGMEAKVRNPTQKGERVICFTTLTFCT